MSNTSVDPSLINWAADSSKRAQDFHLQHALYDILNTKDTISMLSLPAASWAFERGLAANLPTKTFRFYGVEKNVKVWGAMCYTARKANESRYHKAAETEFVPANKPGSTWAYLNSGQSSKVDIAYLDWMGTWARDKEEELALLIKKTKPEKLVFTVALGRGQPGINNMLADVLSRLRGPDAARYMELVENHSIHCALDPKSVSGMKMRAIPCRAEDIVYANKCVESVKFERGRVYDSVTKTGRLSVNPEAFYMFNIKYKD